MRRSLLGPPLALLCLLQGGSAPLQGPPVQGHLVLLVEGDARGLQITAVVPKTEPFGGVPRGLQSRYAIAVLAADGSLLGSYPLDLSHFDLDPAHAGRGPVVQGCQVVDTRVTALANVPRFAAAAALEIRRDGETIHRLDRAAYRELLERGQNR